MNQTDFTIDGGLEAVQEVFKHNQDGMIEAFANMLKNTGTGAANGVVLWGCEVTLTTTTISNDTAAITAGAVYIDGEIYTVDAASGIVRTASEDHVFKVVSSTSSPTLDYFDATTQDPLLVRKATIDVEDNATSGNYMPYNAETWQQRLHGKRTLLTPTVDGDGGGGSLTLNSSAVYYQHDFENNILHIEARLSITVVTAATAYILLQLPTDRDGTQLVTPTGATVSALGNEGDNVVAVAQHSSPDYVKISKIDGATFAVGALNAINLNFDVMVTT